MLDIKLKHLDKEVAHRRNIANLYIQGITNPLLTLPVEKISVENYTPHVWHLFVIRLEQRDALQKYLAENGVQTLIHYPIPPHKQQAYEEWNDLSYPTAEKIHSEVLSLPIGPTLSNNDVNKIIQLCNNFKF